MLLASMRRMNQREVSMESKRTREKAKAPFQVNNGCDAKQGGIRRDGERWWDSKYILRVEQSGLDD